MSLRTAAPESQTDSTIRSTGKFTSQDINALRNTSLDNPPVDHSGEAVKPSLGSDHKICCHTAKREFESPAAYRWWLLKQVKRLLPEDQRLQRCMVDPVPGTPLVEFRRNPNTNTAYMAYIFHCNRPWLCPLCAARISNMKREELTDGLARAKLLNFHPLLLTLTLRHGLDDRLEDLLNGMLGKPKRTKGALRRMQQTKEWKALKKEYGWKGSIRALEVTRGEVNGWHPHLHILIFLDEQLSPQQTDGLKKWFYDLWRAALTEEGFDANFLHGVDVRTADSDVADYIAKWGHEPKEQAWGVEHEIAKATSKRAHRDGLTPFELAEAGADDPRAAALFREYAQAMNGRHQLEWSKELRAKLEAQELPTPDQSSEEVPDYAVIEVDAQENLKRINKCDLQPRLLALTAIGATDDLRALLTAWGVVAVVYDRPPELRAGQPGRADNGIAADGTAISGLESMRDPDVESAQGQRIVFEQHRRDQADQLDQEQRLSRQLELPGAGAKPGPALVYR